MTIKVKDASQRAAVPATAAQIAEIQSDLGILSTDSVQALIQANTSLGALAAPVQTIVDFASGNDRARANHTGVDPAGNVGVILPAGGTTDLQTYINALEIRLTNLGTTAPQNTVQPAAPTGTLTVGSTLTAVTGTWTGASTYNYVWYRVNTTTGVFTATGGTASTYILQPADAGFKMAVSIVGVSAAGIAAAPVSSALTASAVGVTLPANAGGANLPAVTPSGSQAVGVTHTCTTGTWTNASGAVYTYQWTLDGAAISGATANTYTTITGQAGKTLRCNVLATTAQGPAAAAATSNAITITGTPALVNSAAPSFTGTVTENVTNPIIPATWTGGTPDASRTWRIYIAAGSGGLVTPYAQISGTSGTYNPANDSFYQAQTGLSVIAGQSVYIDEVVTYLGVTYTSPKSTVKLIAAASATLAATTDNTNISLTQNSAMTGVKPVSASGGTLPYSYAITPSTTALPAGVTLNSATGVLTGTPTIVSGSTTYSITVTDATAASVVSTFTMLVNTASTSIPLLMYINANETLAAIASHPEGNWSVQMLGTSYGVAGISESTGVTGSSAITGPSTVGPSTKRFARVPDPITPAENMFYFASNSSDPTTANHRNRVELTCGGAPGLAKTGSYWFKVRKYTPTVRFNQTSGIALQVHHSYAPSPATGPFEIAYNNSGGIWPPGPCVTASCYWSSQDDPSVGGFNDNQWYPYISDSSAVGGVSYASGIPTGGTPYGKYGPTALGGTPLTDPSLPTVNGPADSRAFPLNVWNDWIVFYKGDPSGHTGIFKVWLNGVLVVNLSGINIGIPSHPGATTDYVKVGLDSAGGFTNGLTGAWEGMKYLYVVNDAFGPFTFAQINTLGT